MARYVVIVACYGPVIAMPILFTGLIVVVRQRLGVMVVNGFAPIRPGGIRTSRPCDLYHLMLATVMFCSSALAVAVSCLNLCDSGQG